MKLYAVIVAGGTGSRMGNAVPKQFLEIKGKPILFYSINAFATLFPDISIIVVMHPQYMSYFNNVARHIQMPIDITLVPGGANRYESVQNGVNAIAVADRALVFIHDAARPFINKQLLFSLLNTATQFGNAIPTLPLADSIRQVMDNGSTQAVDRSKYKIVQTPQVFKIEQIKQVLQTPFSPNFTDEASAAELQGIKINIVDGLDENIKITTPAQLLIAESILDNGWHL
jgi:2-C-methyl-D-erythritol 4-phosphate cytidylyltransferase